MQIHKYLWRSIAAWVAVFNLAAAEYHGQVNFSGLPVPGAAVTATKGDRSLTAITDQNGVYSFPDLPEGTWTLQIEMLGFSTLKQDVSVPVSAASSDIELKMLSLDDLKVLAGPAAKAPPAPVEGLSVRPPDAKPEPAKPNSKTPATPQNTRTAFQRTDVNAAKNAGTPAAPAPASDAFASQSAEELNQRASDGFLINGAANNGASTPFALNQAFGNNRRGTRSLYNGNFGLILDNAQLDARSFSLTGQDTPKPDYNHLTLTGAFGGPIKIPHLIRNGPNFFINYQWTRNRNAQTQTGLVPTLAERGGDFSQVLNPLGQPVQIFDPNGGSPFPGNLIPQSRISPQARVLLSLYPLPNFTGSSAYNYQIPVIGATHQDSIGSRVNKQIGRKDQFFVNLGYQNTRSDNQGLFGFLDTSDTAGINTNANWRHNFSNRLFGTLGYQYSRFSSRTTPFFENRENISGAAGIQGNNQEPVNWGPPNLGFTSILGLSDATPSFIRNQTSALSYNVLWARGPHTFTSGTDIRKQQFNTLAQQNPRGGFTFTGASTQATANGVPVPGTGSDFAGFLLGIPDASSIAFGNADKYFRTTNYDGFFNDDWKMRPGFTLNWGLRWEYWSPITELYGRLVNLDVAPGFAAVAPVVANNPIGPLTNQKYPDSLVDPDKHAFQPRIGTSWRPISGSSMVVRAGYGVYYDTSVYQTIASQMAQQAPLSKSSSVQNTLANPLTLANGFNGSPGIASNTFAIDPNFRVGYAHTWQASIQRDLPFSLQLVATYVGIKGTRGVQEFYPNTYPAGAVNPCPLCPSGFVYMTSNGNSTRESGQIQLRRRLHNGFTTTLQYTLSKSIDDAALGGRGQGTAVIAQNWLNLSGERSLSNFDQRHLLNASWQYTSGMGLGGGTLLGGWRGALLKEWTFANQIKIGSGLPLSPVYFAVVGGTGGSGSIRPDYTAAPLYEAPAGLSLNPAAFVEPPAGQWGNAGRNSITGPMQFGFDVSMQRTFRMRDRMSLDVQINSTNVLNHVTFANWNTTINSAQFGQPSPSSPNAMRDVQTTVRLRF